MSSSGIQTGASGQDPFEILQSLNKNAESLRSGNSTVRDEMLANCVALMAALETPSEMFMRMVWTYTIHPVMLKLANDMKLMEQLKADGGAPKTVAELSAAEGFEPAMTRKVLTSLASFHALKEVDVDTYAPTPFSNSMADPLWVEGYNLIIPYTSQIFLSTPEFFKEKKYHLPVDALNTPVQSFHDVSGMHTFAIFARDGRMQQLESFLKIWLDQRPHWSDHEAGFYPFKQRLIEGADTSPEAVFLVDVGGGHGQDFPRMFANVPRSEIPGRLVLQDLELVVNSIGDGKLQSDVEKMPYDFFTPQPIRGARVYFMHNIIHNHPDQPAKEILKQVAGAMKKGYSKLLIWDHVMPNKGAGSNICSLDWVMAIFYATSERSETQWRTLLEDPEVGLKVTDIVRYSRYDQDLIELELA